jgi:hypothetical protein
MRDHRPAYRDLTDEQRRRASCRSYTNVLIRRGVLTPQPCEACGAAEVQPHHDDYTKPWTVRWLCEVHHQQHHAEQRAIAGAAQEA